MKHDSSNSFKEHLVKLCVRNLNIVLLLIFEYQYIYYAKTDNAKKKKSRFIETKYGCFNFIVIRLYALILIFVKRNKNTFN